MPFQRPSSVAPAIAIVLAATPCLVAQCGLEWASAPPEMAPWYRPQSVAALPGDGFVVGGFYPYLQGNQNYVARWQDGSWSQLGGGVFGGGLIGGVNSVLRHSSGDIYIGGIFLVAGGVSVHHLARFDGQAWHDVGGGIAGGYGYTWIDDMLEMPNGDLVVAGRFYSPFPWLMRWDGSTWSTFGNGGWEGIGGIAVAPNGDLLCAYNQSSGARVMRWDGVGWSQMGSGSTNWRVEALAVSADGAILAGGVSPPVARWDGSQWSALGSGLNGYVYDLAPLPNGEVIAGGGFTAPGSRLARFDGSAWLPIGSGVGFSVNQYSMVQDVARLADGALVVAGSFDLANGSPAPGLAFLDPACPPNCVSYGAGCSGSAGPVQLVATQLPMLGSTMRSRTTGLPSLALAVAVYAFSQTAIPLPLLHPLGGTGCELLVADEILLEFMVGFGEVQSEVAIPRDLTLIGNDFYHQVVPVELSANGDIAALTSSNGLRLTVGSY